MKDTVGEKGHLSITAIHQQLYEEPTPNHHTNSATFHVGY
jgi:hypothetical protein